MSPYPWAPATLICLPSSNRHSDTGPMAVTTLPGVDASRRNPRVIAPAALACMGKEFIERLKAEPPRLIPGTAVVLGRMTHGVPLPLSHNVNFNHVLHERVLLGAVEMTDTPRVADHHRVTVTWLSEHIARIQLRFGFMEKPDVTKGLEVAVERRLIEACNLRQVTYFTGHETIIPTARQSGMAHWRKAIFALIHHNAQRPAAYFNIPSAQVMEIGLEFEI